LLAGVDHSGEFVFLGSYTGESGGEGEGIALLRRDPLTGSLTRLGVAARTPSPSFLAQHPTMPVLYAVNELDAGTVSAFGVARDGSLSELAVQDTGGRHPGHLAVTPDGRHLLVANYSSGSVSVHPLDADGAPGVRTDVLDLHGRGPDPDRQDGPHAHQVTPDRIGPDVLITDLGADRIWRSRLDPHSGRLGDPVMAVPVPPGVGPRHLLVGADGTVFFTGELAGVLGWQDHDGERGMVAASTTVEENFPSELAAGRDGRFVYVANRGPDTVSAFAWDGGKATLVAEVPTGGSWPRHMALLFDHLYVANERSHTVTVFRLDPDTGIPYVQGEPIAEASPACILGWERQHR
jgi:6-phosphogluconolactonase